MRLVLVNCLSVGRLVIARIADRRTLKELLFIGGRRRRDVGLHGIGDRAGMHQGRFFLVSLARF
ncbi:MAG TPA: hypothetical protein VKR29_13485, partial [Candidatus Binataceae bacterium]|nr:hypothetical protein [Candidatus Binataceae bacterium]